ncbi:MAG: lipoyl(octanoyl) transferase LipB [Bacteroidetes bacterium]|nr:lipoyl(octanoyl) transferase LipB [Bacteroidota bacterium]
MKFNVSYRNLGLITYANALKIQEDAFNNYLIGKRKDETAPVAKYEGHLFLCEHPHVITLGKSGAIENLLINNDQLRLKGVEFFHSSRGGDITYHGPGQIVGYPVLDLERFGLSVKAYIHLLEDVIIQTLQEYRITAGRIPEMTGVWVDSDHLKSARKICAIGVKVSRWVSMHGFAFNIQTDLSYFNTIVPCGIKGKAVTSLSEELGYDVQISDVKNKIKKHFSNLFDANMATA